MRKLLALLCVLAAPARAQIANLTIAQGPAGCIAANSCTSVVNRANRIVFPSGCTVVSGAGEVDLSCAGSGVSSVGLALPSIFTVSGSPVTGTGTLTGVFAAQAANTVLAGPASGAAAAPSMRAIVAGDLPYPLLGPADSSGAPNYSWAADSSMGIFRIGAKAMGFSDGTNTVRFDENQGGPTFSSTTQVVAIASGITAGVVGLNGTTPGAATIIAGNCTAANCAGGTVTLLGGNATGAANGGSISILGGAGGAANTSTVAIDGSNGTSTGVVEIGVSDAVITAGTTNTIKIGRNATPQTTTTVNGLIALSANGASSFTTSAGALTLTGGAASTWSTSAGALTVDSAAALNLGNTNATSIAIGHGAIVTQLTGNLTFSSNTAADSSTAPTISSGFGTGATIASNNGTAGFTITIGNPAAASGVLTMPTDSHFWHCACADVTTVSTSVFYCKTTASGTNTVTLGNFNTAGSATSWTASDTLLVTCRGW